MTITPVIERLRGEILDRWPDVKIGVYNCRPKRRSSSWSEHAWGNAADIHVTSKAQGDEIYRWLITNKTRLSLATICWRDHGGCNAADHQTHIHVAGAPKHPGQTPPCADKKAGFDMNTIKSMQRGMKAAGFYTGNIDGLWGPLSEKAFSAMAQAAAQTTSLLPTEARISGVVTLKGS